MNIFVEDKNVPIYVSQKEYELLKNAIVVEDVRQTYAVKKWSKLIKEMCNNTCQCCGSKHNLASHHILSFKNYFMLRIDLKNGICLCRDCHTEYHKRYDLDECSALNLFEFIEDFRKNNEEK